jgi:GNAT superfamily N-acetyltransferase
MPLHVPAPRSQAPVIRRELRDGDAESIGDLHRRIYQPEYGMNDRFVASVSDDVRALVTRGWPAESGGVWLIDAEDGLAGSLALSDEGDGVGRVRWFVLDPSLRGHGLGRAMVHELVDTARGQGMMELELVTFSALTVAARIYRSVGFRVVREEPRADWGPPITFQRYELDLVS